MKRIKFNLIGTIFCILALVACNSGNNSTANSAYTPPTTATVQFTVMGTQKINASIDGTRAVDVLISSQSKLNDLKFDNLSELLAANPSWRQSGEFNCPILNTDNSCILNLTYSPTSLTHSGKLTIKYSYSTDSDSVTSSVDKVLTSSSSQSGSLSLDYAATSSNNVNATVSPAAPIQELIGLSQSVAISFSSDNSKDATNLQITTGLSNLSTTNSGWSGPSQFSCANLKQSCVLTLSYAPTLVSQNGTVNLSYSYTNSSGSISNATVTIPYQSLSWGSNYSSSNIQYMTASTVEAQNTNMSGIYPVVSSDLSVYLSVNSALGYLGPISQLGPLGPLGPLGANLWNPSAWISGAYSWNSYFSIINGPLSASGPLGQNGPYTEANYYNGSIFSTNQFAANTRNFGLWSILGATGPLGAVGALGPLGTIGATGLVRNPATGQFTNTSGNVVRSLSVPYNGKTSRSFDVYENYAQNFATQMVDNDTSFMVEGSLGYNASNSYTINSSQDQIVTVLTVPDTTLMSDVIYVSVYTTSGKLIALSNSDSYINYVEFTAPKGSYMVKITKSALSLSSVYRLYVTGSYTYLNQSYIKGNYIKTAKL